MTVWDDKVARVWDAETGKLATLLQGFEGYVSFSVDGRRLVTVFHKVDKGLIKALVVQIWDFELGKVLASFEWSDLEAAAVFSADNSHIITVSDKADLRWRVFAEAQELVDETKRIIPRCLTRDQRAKAFLDAEPPAWCIEMEKWPYQSQDWKDWLKDKRANLNPPLPDSAEWQQWASSRTARQ